MHRFSQSYHLNLILTLLFIAVVLTPGCSKTEQPTVTEASMGNIHLTVSKYIDPSRDIKVDASVKHLDEDTILVLAVIPIWTKDPDFQVPQTPKGFNELTGTFIVSKLTSGSTKKTILIKPKFLTLGSPGSNAAKIIGWDLKAYHLKQFLVKPVVKPKHLGEDFYITPHKLKESPQLLSSKSNQQSLKDCPIKDPSLFIIPESNHGFFSYYKPEDLLTEVKLNLVKLGT